MKAKLFFLGILLASLNVTGCAAVSLVDAAASTAIGAGKLAVKGTTAAVNAVIPESDDEKKKK